MPRLFHIIFLIILVTITCSKENANIDHEKIQVKWKELLSRDWICDDGYIWWRIDATQPTYQCNQTPGNRINPIDSTYFKLRFTSEGKYSLEYSIPIMPADQYCNDKYFEVETPERIQKIEGEDDGLYYLTISPASWEKFTIESLANIGFKSSKGNNIEIKPYPTLYCIDDDSDCHLNLTFVDFDQFFIIRLHFLG